MFQYIDPKYVILMQNPYPAKPVSLGAQSVPTLSPSPGTWARALKFGFELEPEGQVGDEIRRDKDG